jgi:hypothetical protein
VTELSHTPPQQTSRRRRLARLLVVPACAVVAVQLFSAAPKDQEIVFQGGHAIERLEASWSRPGHTEPLGGVVLEPEGSPARVVHHVSLPNGDYVLNAEAWGHRSNTAGQPILVANSTSAQRPRTTYVGRVTLEGGRTIISLREGS